MGNNLLPVQCGERGHPPFVDAGTLNSRTQWTIT